MMRDMFGIAISFTTRLALAVQLGQLHVFVKNTLKVAEGNNEPGQAVEETQFHNIHFQIQVLFLQLVLLFLKYLVLLINQE